MPPPTGPPRHRIVEFKSDTWTAKPVDRTHYDDSEDFPTTFPYHLKYSPYNELARSGFDDKEIIARAIEMIRREIEYPRAPYLSRSGGGWGIPGTPGASIMQVAARILPAKVIIDAIEKEENADIASVLKIGLVFAGDGTYVPEIPGFIKNGTRAQKYTAWCAFGQYVNVCEVNGREAVVPEEMPGLVNAIRDEVYRHIYSRCTLYPDDPNEFHIINPLEQDQKNMAERLGVKLDKPLNTRSQTFESYWEAVYAAFNEGNTWTRFNIIYALGDYDHGDKPRQMLEKLKKELEDAGGSELLIAECERGLKKQ